jgi:hypothetical protein
VFRAACCASTGAASISGTGECGSPLERSWRWEDACSPQARADGAPRLTRADAARVTIMLRSSEIRAVRGGSGGSASVPLFCQCLRLM